MSLKSFHILFIAVSALTCLGFGLWLLVGQDGSSSFLSVAGSAVSFLAAAALMVYGVKFVRRFRHVSYM
jgi:hypothetical protein